MLQGRPRELAKRLLEISRAKLVFDRITKTRHTRFYFFLSGFTCLLLCALQAVILSDNTKAVEILTEVVDEAETPPHVTVLKNGELFVCDTIPDRQDSNCILLWTHDHETGPLSVEKRSRTPRNRRTKLRRQAPAPGSGDDSADEGGVSSASEDSDGGFESDDDGAASSGDEQDDELEVPQNPGGQAPPAPSPSTTSPVVISATTSTRATLPPAPPRTSSASSSAVPTIASNPPPRPTSATLSSLTSSISSSTTSSSVSSSASRTTTSIPASPSTPTSSSTRSPVTLVPPAQSTTSAAAPSSEASSTSFSTVSSFSTSETLSRSPTSIVTVSTGGRTTSISFSSTSVAGTTSITFTSSPSQTASTSPTRSRSSTKTSEVAEPTSTKVLKPDSPQNSGISLSSNSNTPHSMSCIYSLSWLEEVLHDSQREDVATLFFQFWLFGVGLVAILNESLPHLGAALVGHLMSAGWSSSRIQGSKSLASLYRNFIVPGPCEGEDLLGTWWELRLAHTIPVVVFNIVGLFGLSFLSYKLLRVYSAATFDKAGPTLALQRAYKVVLLFSVVLQLSGFFTAVSSGLWLSKVAHGNFKELSHHEGLYTASFVVILAALFPWLILGWVCVRKECKKRFWLFAALSVGLLAISGVMFGSDAYTSIFKSWRLFAVVTITSFVLIVFTTVLGLLCYFNYGKGLQAYLQLSEEPEGADFDPVGGFKGSEKQFNSYEYAPALHEKNDLEWSSPRVLPQPPTAAEVDQYVSRTAPPTIPAPQAPASSNPFASDVNSVAAPKSKGTWTEDGAGADAQPFRTVPPPEPVLRGLGFLQEPQRSIGLQPRVPSFAGTVTSFVTFEGLPAPPFTPHPPTRAGSVRSTTRSPFPIASMKANHNPRNSVSSVDSASSMNSTRSIKKSPFPLTPVAQAGRSSSLRDSGYSMSSSDQSSLIGKYMRSESEFGLARSVRQSIASSASGEHQTVAAPGRRETFGTGTPLVEEVPRSLYVANQI